MRLFLDTDILLDVLLERQHFDESAKVVDWAEGKLANSSSAARPYSHRDPETGP